jgi:hypothetical protein
VGVVEEEAAPEIARVEVLTRSLGLAAGPQPRTPSAAAIASALAIAHARRAPMKRAPLAPT